MININELIKSAIKSKNKKELLVYQAIKAEILNYKTAKNAKPLDDAAEISIIKKMVKQRIDSRNQYIEAGRTDLSNSEAEEIAILTEFLPKEATAEDINKAIFEICEEKGWFTPIESGISPQIPKKSMGEAIKLIKTKLNNVDGKVLADSIKSFLV